MVSLSNEARERLSSPIPLCIRHAQVIGDCIRAGVISGFDLCEGLHDFGAGAVCYWELDYPACELP